MLYDYTVDRPRVRFYGKEGKFNNFMNITEDTLNEIKQKLQTFLKNIDSENLSYNELYEKVYEFLGSPMAYSRLNTFDEQIIFLILALDPKLLYLNTYREMGMVSLKDIEAAKNKEKTALEAKRKNQHNEFIARMRDRFGIYDSKFLRYEALYFEHIIKPDSYTEKVSADAIDFLFQSSFIVRSFARITDERFLELKSIAEDYKKLIQNSTDMNILACNILCKRRGFKTLTLRERYALFIFIIDPDLKILKIYEEESTMEEIKRRCVEEFGYFNESLIRLESLYHQRFCPEKKISDWSEERMLLWKKD